MLEIVEFIRSGESTFLNSLKRIRDSKAKAIIARRLENVKSGTLGDHKSVGGGVSELRIHFGSGYRVYYGMDGSTIVVLLLASDKATQEKSIKTAIDYWKEYKNAKS